MPLDLEPLDLEPVGSKLDLEPLDLEPVAPTRAARRADLQAQQAAARSSGETTSFSARAAAGIEQGLRTPEVMIRGGLDALQYYRGLDLLKDAGVLPAAPDWAGGSYERQNEAWLKAFRDRDEFLAREAQAIEGRDSRNFAGDLTQGVARGIVELPPQLMAGVAGAARGAAVKFSSVMGGAQGALSQYAQDRGEGRSQLEALPPAVSSGLITAVTTRAFGDTGIESVFRNEGVQGFRRRLLGVLKDAGMEGAEEFVDQAQQDLLERATRNPGKPLGDSFYDTMQALAVGTAIGGAATAPRLIQRAARPVIVNEQTGTTDFPPLDVDELPAPPQAAVESQPLKVESPEAAPLSTFNLQPSTPLSPATPPTGAAPAPTAEVAPPVLSPPAPLALEAVAEVPEAPGVPPPLEGQPYEPGPLQRPEAAMETRRPAPLNLQREPAVSPELADAIAAVRGGYNPEVEAQPETLTPDKALDLSVRHEAEQKQLPINRRLFWHGSPEVKSVGGRFSLEKHRTDRGDWGRGAYLTQFPGITRNYGEVAHPLVAAVSNPASKTDVERVQRALRSGREKYLAGEDTASATTRLLQKEGFDSAAISFIEDPKAISELVVFDPSKVKSASSFPAWISDNFRGKLRFPEEFKRQGDSYVFKPATSPQPTPPDQSGGPTELTPERVQVDPKTDELLGTNSRGEPIYWSANAKTHYAIANGRIATAPWVEGLPESALTRLDNLLSQPAPPPSAPADLGAGAASPKPKGGPAKLTPPAKAAVDELSKLRQQAKELDAKIQKSKSGTEANRKRLAEWMRLTAQIAKLETGQTAAATVKPAAQPTPPGQSGAPTELTPPAKLSAQPPASWTGDARKAYLTAVRELPIIRAAGASQFRKATSAGRNKVEKSAFKLREAAAVIGLEVAPRTGVLDIKAELALADAIESQLTQLVAEIGGPAAQPTPPGQSGGPTELTPPAKAGKLSSRRGAAAGGTGTITGSKERRGSEMPAEAGSTPAPTEGAAPRRTPPAKAKASPLSPAEVSEFNALEQARRDGTLDAAGAARYREFEVRAGQGDFLAAQPKPLTEANVPTAAKVTPTQAESAANPKTDFNAKFAKEQKKFLLDAVDKALAEAPDTTRAEIQELWLASEHYKASKAGDEWAKTNPAPEGPNRHHFGYTTEESQKYSDAEVAHRQVLEAWKQRRDAALAPIAAPYLADMVGGADVSTALSQGTELAFYRSLPHITIEVPGDGTFSIVNTKDAIRDFKERAAKFPTTAARAKAPTQSRVNATPVPALGAPTKENIFKAAAVAMSTDSSRAVINTVWSDGEQTVATDGRRLHVFDKGVGGTKKKPVMLDAKGKQVFLDRDYPNWKQVRPEEAVLSKIFSGQDAAKLWTVLKQAEQMVDEKSESVKLWWNPDRTLGVSSGSEAGTYEHNVTPQAKLVGAWRPEFLMDALDAARKTGSEKVDVHWVDELSPLVIRAKHMDALIMPMQLTGPSPLFEPTMLNKYDLAKTPAQARAMMEKDLKALEDLRKPTGSDAVKADWLRDQLGVGEDLGAEIERLEAKRKAEAAKPRKTALQRVNQEAINSELQARIDALRVRQRNSAAGSRIDSALAALESAKVKPGGPFALPDLGLTVTLWNGTLTAAQLALRAGRSLAQAVQAGVDWLRAQGQQFDEAKVRAALEQGILQAPGIREHVGKRLLQEDFSPAAKAALEPLLRYEVKPDAQLFAEAAAVVEAIGPMAAEANYWGNPWGLPADAHVVLGFAIGNGLSTLEAQASAAGDTALADRIGRQNAEFQSQFVLQSTETARTLRAYRYFDLVGNLSPFTADLFARKVIEQASQKQKQRLKPTLDAAKQQLDDLNRTGIEEAARTPEVQGTARTVINQAIEEEARQAGTPVQQAIAAEVVAQLQTAGRLNAVEAAIVREHFGQNPEPLALADKLERAGVKPAKARAAELEGKYKDGVEAFRAKLREKLAEARKKNIDPATLGIVDKAIRQRLADLQVKLGALVRQHWTQQERVGQTLADSLVQEAGLPEAQATRLADAIQRRFKALVQARKEKALRNLAKTPGARELQKPSVAQRIIEATNLGALDSEGLWQAVAEKLGLPTYTADASAEVKRLAERAQQLPEGSVQRQEATARLMRFIARQKGINLGDLGWAFWYANTLSGPFTHAVNTFSNTLSLAGNVATQFRDVRGIPQILAATADGFRTGLTEARAIVKQGPGANRTKFTEQGQALENLDPQDFTGAGLVRKWRYVARALAAADAAFYFPAREAKAITLARALARQEGKTGAAIRTRAQQLIDGTEEQQNLWGAQVDRERAQLEAMGERPDALWTTRRLEQLREQNWGADIGEAADDFALRTTYNNRPDGLVGTLSDVAKYGQRRVPGARGVVPFVNVVANVVNDSINYTPWGFARAYAASRTGEPSVTLSLPFEWAENLREGKSPMTPDAVVDLHAKAALGTVMVGSLMAMALAGLDDDDGENFQLYGAGPKDAAAKAALRETGWLPYSVRVSGKYLSFANTPLAIPLGALGHYLDAARYDKRFEQADAFNRLGVALWGGAHIITQQSFLDGLARLLGALEERRGRIDTASDRAVEQAFRTASSVAVPNALRQLDRLFDPTIYDARGIEGALVAGIPFARRNGSPALNAFGEPITNEPWKRFASDAEANVWADLARRKIYPSVADKAKNANGREMTDDEHYRYVQESGQAIKRRLETPGMRRMIQTGKEDDARKAVTAIVREERERARRRLGF